MKGNCGECERRWFCYINPDECDAWPDPVPMTNADHIRCDGLFWNCRTIDGDYYPVQFWRDPDGDIGIWGADNVKKYQGNIAGFNWFNRHFKAAREARFEYGEHPRRIK